MPAIHPDSDQPNLSSRVDIVMFALGNMKYFGLVNAKAYEFLQRCFKVRKSGLVRSNIFRSHENIERD